MTAVLPATDALRRDRIMASLDDNHNYSPSVDWRAKYNEVADMLAETRGELDDFHHSSKELEEELERELERTEKAHQELMVKVAKAESERDEWKAKFMSLQTTHNTTTTSLQRELDKLRQEHQATKVQLRELEMGNDDLERNERAVSSSLADVEAKYSRALEEKILLEHELLDKANVEEECQRLKDELRDANVEVSILKDQLATAQQSPPASIETPAAALSLFSRMPSTPSDDNLLSTPPPPDLQLSELDEPAVARRASRAESPTAYRSQSKSTTPADTSLTRSKSISTSQSRMPPPRTIPAPRPVPLRAPSTSAPGNITTLSRNKGVQMVSEMRARVKNLEQKIHTRVPRLRMGSTTSRPSVGTPTFPRPSTELSTSTRSVGNRTSQESVASDKSKEKKDSSGWVLIMEDSPSPVRVKMTEKEKDRERRRASSPLGNSASYRPMQSTSAIPTQSTAPKALPLHHSTSSSVTSMRKQSRHSAASTASSSSVNSANSSRPQTPTYLPMATPSLYSYSGTAGLKRSTGGALDSSLTKRASLGSSGGTERGYTRERTSMPPPRQSGTPSSTASTTSSSSPVERELPTLPNTSNVTMRLQSKVPPSALLSQTRIGRPSGGGPGRRSTDLLNPGFSDDEPGRKEEAREIGRRRSGTTNSVFGFGNSRNGS